MRWLTRMALAAWLAACGVLCGPAWGQSTQPASAPRPEILELVAQLGDKRWAVREAAHRKLQALRDPGVVPALQQAASSSDVERALRAKSLLARLLDFSHVVLDALGEPIPDATIVLTAPEPGAARLMPPLTLTANMFGGVALPPLWDRPQGIVRFHHKLYGLAQGYEPYRPVRPETPGQPVLPTPIVVPMVAQDSPAYAQSLRGQVVGPDGKGLAGAEISCQNVRSPNGESFSSYDALQAVLTDENGRFAFYPAANSRAQKGRRLVAPGSRYFVNIRVPGTEFFPYAGEHDNAAPAIVGLARPERFHRFEFETADGGRVGSEAANYIALVYRPTPSRGVNLDPAYVRAGGKLLPGFYSARDGQSGATYLTLEVTKDSPEVLLFRLPPPITYRGRVLDGTTGKPMPGAFVIAHSEDRGEGLLRLKDEDWAALETLPAGTAKDNRALNPLRNHYSFRSLVRTDEQGQYEIQEPASLRSSSLMAFARNRLPCFQRTTTLARTPEDKSPLADLPLFPAARVTVQPVTQTSESVAPEWEFPAEGQPEWLARLNALVRGSASEPQIGRPNLLQANQPHTLFVPAGVRLTLIIRAPHNDRLSTARVNKPIQLPPGGALDVGQVAFEPALSVAIRVTGPDGKPVSGVPLRRIYFPDDRWSVACTTDSDGLARFYVRKNSHGYFSVPNILPSSFVRAHPGRATIPFQIEATVPAEPLSIPLTASQVQALPGRPIADIPQ